MNHSLLIDAYLGSVYSFENFNLKINHQNNCFHDYCVEHQILSWAFITAWNPQSRILNDEENFKRNSELCRDLVDYDIISGLGKGDDWPAEESFFISNIEFKKALALARKYNQKAFVYGVIESLPELIVCEDFD